jgi:DNA-binding IclR family transcriptional regulator
MTRPLEVGPLRDLLAKLSEAERGDEWLDVADICERTGLPYSVARRRVAALVASGYATESEALGVPHYRITDKGRELLNGRS